ncbi:MAG: hypothetical protein HY303_11065 [Candidatus Wallbacteria bacterium]|nr:hypothetical protein [Candidatus Wallbacteria bacterium]
MVKRLDGTLEFEFSTRSFLARGLDAVWLVAALGLVLAALAHGQAAPPAQGLTDADQVVAPVQLRMKELPGDSALFQTKFGKPDLTNDVPPKIDEDDLNYAVRNWPLLPPDNSANQAFFDNAKDEVKKFIADHRASDFFTALTPAVAWDRDGNPGNGVQPLLAPTLAEARTAFIERPALRTAEPSFLADNQITEAQDTDGNYVYKFGKTDPGNWYRFDDVKVTWYFQKTASLPDKGQNNRVPDMDGTKINDETQLESPAFLAKYEKLDAPVSKATSPVKFRLTDPSTVSVKYGPPGDVAFDPGHQAFDPNDPRFEKEKMQVYVVSKAKVMRAPAAASPVPAASFVAAGNFKEIGERKLYVEDHYPPMPKSADELAKAIKASAGNLPPSNADIDLPSLDKVSEANNQPVARRGFPDPSRGEGLLASLNVDNDNPNDVNSKSTMNFEIGRSIRDRYRYSAEGKRLGPGVELKDLDRYIIYVPPYEVTDKDGNKIVDGPYVGTVDAANPNPEDPYAKGSWLTKYTPIAFDGNLLKAVNFLYENTPEKAQANYGKTDAGTGTFGYPNTAKIVYKMGAECIIGITAHGSNLAVTPGALAVPLGFASYAGQDYKASIDADLNQPDLSGKPHAGNGGPNSGVDARDSYFKVNAADCCGNEKVLVSGTYSTVDNIRPNAMMTLEEAQTRATTTDTAKWTVGVPNDVPAGTNAAVSQIYSYDSPHSRVDASKPVSQRLYGDYANQAHDWSSEAPPGISNPPDAQGHSFLDITASGTKPPILQNHRMNMKVCGEDNLGEVEKSGKIMYPIGKMTVRVFQPDGSQETERTLVDESNNSSPQPLSPCQTMEYVFHSDGTYKIVVSVKDLSGNERVMTVTVPVRKETAAFQKIEAEHGRGQN